MTVAQRYRIAVAGERELDGCYAVRREVFVTEQGVPEHVELDAYDAHAVHLLATSQCDGRPAGTARILYGAVARRKYPRAVTDDLTAVLGRLAVGRSARGTGLGAALVRAVEDEARRLGLTHVYLEAQTHALPFYERLGYAAYGPEFDEGSGIPHRAMRRTL
ncbi:GNAT family N-acetyltransferase [Streptantibioticus rubrisoli]|uniref:GNAT family N-acetyltransferase n=1 Tax=Streptantibioticus rubrisoli TaxID=1387313 RepID=A0ABT1PKQ1_9ACTN|nr:GNAT family N-acetyltransferase [Streptantibioticus rubrisoli]MCQ4045929.1 GNAT family N-acetyltransferase [Streptantibioticus rubrisoli]